MFSAHRHHAVIDNRAGANADQFSHSMFRYQIWLCDETTQMLSVIRQCTSHGNELDADWIIYAFQKLIEQRELHMRATWRFWHLLCHVIFEAKPHIVPTYWYHDNSSIPHLFSRYFKAGSIFHLFVIMHQTTRSQLIGSPSHVIQWWWWESLKRMPSCLICTLFIIFL